MRTLRVLLAGAALTVAVAPSAHAGIQCTPYWDEIDTPAGPVPVVRCAW